MVDLPHGILHNTVYNGNQLGLGTGNGYVGSAWKVGGIIWLVFLVLGGWGGFGFTSG